MLTGLHDSCSSQIDWSYNLYSLALSRVSFRDFPLYKVPFPHEYVLEVGQRRMVLRYKGHERVVFSYVHFCFYVLVLSFCLRK